MTLEEGGIVRFPDAPTERGIKHMEELILAMEECYEAYIIFVVQMKNVVHFEPNDAKHKAFGDTLRKAKEKGVHILAMDCHVTPESLRIGESIPVAVF